MMHCPFLKIASLSLTDLRSRLLLTLHTGFQGVRSRCRCCEVTPPSEWRCWVQGEGALTMMSPFSSWAGSMAMWTRPGFSGPTLLWDKRDGRYVLARLNGKNTFREKAS